MTDLDAPTSEPLRTPWVTLRVGAWRRGLATNSSSTHSMIRSPQVRGLEVPRSLLRPRGELYDFSEDREVLAFTPLQKRRYLARTLMEDPFLYPREYGDPNYGAQTAEAARTILALCGLPESELQELLDGAMGDLQGGVHVHSQPGSRVPGRPDGAPGPDPAWLSRALASCDDPETIFCDEAVINWLGLRGLSAAEEL